MSMLTSMPPSALSSSGLVTAAPVAPRKPGLFVRLVKRLIESRQRQVERELRRHRLHLPSELEAAGWRINERNEDSLPFMRQ